MTTSAAVLPPLTDGAGELLETDHYILREWNSQSAETVLEQRTRLFKQWVQLGNDGRGAQQSIPKISATSLSPDQETLLRSIRTASERDIARGIVREDRPWLRTVYDAASAQHQFFTQHLPKCDLWDGDDIDMLTGIGGPPSVLNDENLYNFGSDWARVLDLYPEIVDNYRKLRTPEDIEEQIEDIRVRWRGMRDGYKEDGYDSDDSIISDRKGDAHGEIQAVLVTGMLLLQGATPDGASILFLDAIGRIVRRSDIAIEFGDSCITIFSRMYHRGMEEMPEWLQGKDGVDYDDDGCMDVDVLVY